MRIKLIQRAVGRYDWASNDDILTFKLGIYDSEGIVTRGGEKAILEYRGEPGDLEYFQDPINEIDEVFEKCWEYAGRVFGSTNYRLQCITFFEVYSENFKEINSSFVTEEEKALRSKIEALQKKLDKVKGLSDLSWGAYHSFKKSLDQYERWEKESGKRLSQLVDGSRLYYKELEKYNRYRKLANEYRLLIDKTEV